MHKIHKVLLTYVEIEKPSFKQSDIACLKKNNTLSYEVKQSNNNLSLQNLSHNSSIRDGEIQEIREIKEIQTVSSCVVSVEEAVRILEEEGF